MNIRTLVRTGYIARQESLLTYERQPREMRNHMTYSEYKESDLHKCVSVGAEATVSIAKFTVKATTLLFRFFRWLVVSAYTYVMK